MPLPSWVYNQTILPPWMTQQTAVRNPPRIPLSPQGMPGVAVGPGNSPGMSNRSFFPTNTPGSTTSGGRYTQTGQYIQPPSTMQPGVGGNTQIQPQQQSQPPNFTTNQGMVGLLPANYYTGGGNTGSMESTPQFAESEYEDDSGILSQLTSQLSGMQSPLNSEYAGIMAQLQAAMQRPGQRHTPFVPEEQKYSQSAELTNAIEMIRQLAESGGYSEEDKSNLRARGVSPIRSVYANAQQNLDRSKALQGGYSPGHTAATTKMARELSDKIAGQTTNVNADIADKVAQGKMAMAPHLGNITSHVNDLINSIAGTNVGARNTAGMFNTRQEFDVNQANNQNQNQLLGMIQNLFGTNADITGRNADRAVNVAGLGQRSIENRNQNRLATSTARNTFNTQNRELSQQMQQFMQRMGLDTADLNARVGQNNIQNNMQGRELDQNMQQFLQRMGLDTAQMNQQGNQANQRNNFDWAQLNQQGGLELIQALMQLMGQQGRA